MIEKLNASEFDKVFEILKVSFPVDEIRTYKEQKALLSNPLYHVFVSRENDEILGAICVWDFDETLFIEHFAVSPNSRGRGIGSALLKGALSLFKGRACLEVEPPNDSLSKRRIEFYKRNGFFFNAYPYFQPAITKGTKAIPLFIMTSEREVDKDEFNCIRNLLYQKVYHYKLDN